MPHSSRALRRAARRVIWRLRTARCFQVDANESKSYRAHQAYVTTLRDGVRLSACLRQWDAEMKIKQCLRKVAKQVSTMSLVFEVDDASKLEAVPYHLQGDPDLYTEGRVRQRQQLSRHPRVTEAIDAFCV